MTMIGIREENDTNASEAKTKDIRPEPEEEVPEAENFTELSKQPSAWLKHFAPVASILYKGTIAAVQMLSTADTISEVPPLEPELTQAPTIEALFPQWGAGRETPAVSTPIISEDKKPDGDSEDEEVALRNLESSRERKNSPAPLEPTAIDPPHVQF